MADTDLLAPENVDRIRRQLLAVDRLPTISTMFEKIISLLEDQNSSVKDVEKVIRLDQVISTRILRLINSSYYGYGNITSISHGITLLGFNTLKNLVLSASLSAVINVGAPMGRLSVADFWLHSIGVASICKLLSLQTGVADPEEMFTLGLLHDIGKVMYLKETPEFFQALLDRSQQEQKPLFEVENEVGVSHAHLGWFLCEKWNFPPKISSVIKNHHSVNDEDEFANEEAIVNLADYLTLKLDIGSSGNSFPGPPAPVVSQRLKISKNSWTQIKEKLQEQRDAVVQLSEQLLKS